jgi:hypothetical protein
MSKRLAKVLERVSKRPGSGNAVKLKRISALTISTRASTMKVHATRDRILRLIYCCDNGNDAGLL